MNTDDQYVPSEKTLLDHYEELSLTVSGDPEVAAGNRTEAEKLLARVRRDAAREALDGLMHRFELEQGRAASLNRGLDAQRAKLSRLTTKTYRDTHYPETEDQP